MIELNFNILTLIPANENIVAVSHACILAGPNLAIADSLPDSEILRQ